LQSDKSLKIYSEDCLYHWTMLHYICATWDSSICANYDNYYTGKVQVI